MESAVRLKEIRIMTGHESDDAVRMALTRAGIKADGVDLGTWPPTKLWDAERVWNLLSERIIKHAAQNAKAKDMTWRIYGSYIRSAALAQGAEAVFSDKMD